MDVALAALVTISSLFLIYVVWSKHRTNHIDFEPPKSAYPTPEEIRRGLKALERSANDGR